MNTTDLGITKEYSIYIPSQYLNYKYIQNLTSDYIDLSNISTLTSGQSYSIVRVYFDRPGLVQERTIVANENIQSLTLQEANVTDDFFARIDAMPICVCTFCLMVLLVWVFNSITEFFNKGGLFKI